MERSVSAPAILAILLTATAPTAAAQEAPPGAASAGSPAASTVERYVLDPSHTWIGFSARHMLVTKVRGKFNDFEGEIFLDTSDVTRSRANVTIQVQSVDTDNQRRDDHLRSSDFFEAGTYPTITFRGTGVERDGEQLFLVGDLTIKDTTREVRMPFEMLGPVDGGRGTKRLGAEGEIEVDRFDWGLRWDRAMEAGGLVVGEDVTLEINVEAVHRPDEAG